MADSSFFTYQTPLGQISIASNGRAITHIAFGVVCFDGMKKASLLTNKASTQILQYLAGKRTEFDLPFEYHGSRFQEAVWAAICTIPYGETRSYTDIAAAVGSPQAARAVGMAANKNPLPLIIPCHRVVGSQGKPVGYTAGIKMKNYLLNLEQASAAHS